ncbi:MAG: type II toxin-antitoxin system VapC family toxin [Candidatus Micrarchaeia archaeon]
MSVTFDSYAWIEYFSGSTKGERVRRIVDDTGQIFTPSICLMEIVSKYIREGKPFADRADFIMSRSSIIDITKEISLLAAELKEKEKLPGVDALIYACARSRSSNLLTGDQHFRGKDGIDFLD